MTFLNLILLQAAVDSTTVGKNGMTQMLIMLALVGVVFYFFMIKPQQKRQKQLKEMRENLKKGDAVITSGGIHGTVVKVTENDVIITIATNVEISVDKSCVFVGNNVAEVQRM